MQRFRALGNGYGTSAFLLEEESFTVGQWNTITCGTQVGQACNDGTCEINKGLCHARLPFSHAASPLIGSSCPCVPWSCSAGYLLCVPVSKAEVWKLEA
jgi:hypothetical protein